MKLCHVAYIGVAVLSALTVPARSAEKVQIQGILTAIDASTTGTLVSIGGFHSFDPRSYTLKITSADGTPFTCEVGRVPLHMSSGDRITVSGKLHGSKIKGCKVQATTKTAQSMNSFIHGVLIAKTDDEQFGIVTYEIQGTTLNGTKLRYSCRIRISHESPSESFSDALEDSVERRRLLAAFRDSNIGDEFVFDGYASLPENGLSKVGNCQVASRRQAISKPEQVKSEAKGDTPSPPKPAGDRTTWHKLRFGMSLAEAKQALSQDGLEVKPGRGSEAFDVSPNFNMDIPGSVVPARFRPVLGISNNGLYEVTLTLDWDAYHEKDSYSPPTVISSLSEPIYNQLALKYGHPVSESGRCTDIHITTFIIGSGRSANCRATWKRGNQLVTLSWAYTHSDETTYFLVEYKPEVDGL